MRWLTLVALLLVSPAWAQAPAAPPPASANAKLPEVEPSGFQGRVLPERVLLGEPFTYELVITHPADQRYELDLPPDLGDFELLSQSREPPKAGMEPAVTVFRLKLSAFDLGMVTLPSVPFVVSTPEGPKRFVAPGQTLEVGSTLPMTPSPRARTSWTSSRRPRWRSAPDGSSGRWRECWSPRRSATWRGASSRSTGAARPRLVEPPAPLDVRTRRALEALQVRGPARPRAT